MNVYLRFAPRIEGVRQVYDVLSRKRGSRLGKIEWYAPWRRYVFVPKEATVWSSDCLMEVAQFMVTLFARRQSERGSGNEEAQT